MNVVAAQQSICAVCASMFADAYHQPFKWWVHGPGFADIRNLDEAIEAAVLQPTGELRDCTGSYVSGNILAVCTVGGVTLCRTHAVRYSRKLLDRATRWR